MAEEDNEILDWGNEDDAVSLGDEDERLTLEDSISAPQNGPTDVLPGTNSQVAAPTRSLSLPPEETLSAQTPDHKTEVPTAEQSKPPPTPSQSNHKLTIPTRLTHALPPKPVTASIPYVPPSDPTIVEATAMASRPKKVDTSGHELKDGSRYDHIGPLPPQWEIRFSRDRPNEFYYYDLRYKVSTWDRPSTSTSSATDVPVALSHDDRHYRPDTRHNSGSARRYEGNGDSDGHQNRHHPGTNERSPERGRDHSRSLSPQGRESRVHGNQRPPRRGNKPNGPQKESTIDLPKNDNRPSVPSSATQHFAKSVRRQLNRAQNQSKDDRAVDTQSGELSHVIQHKEASSKGHNRNRDRTYASDHTNDTTNSTLRPISPLRSPEEEPVIIYQTKVESRCEKDTSPERPRSPPSVSDPNPPVQNRRDRLSRFDPGSEKANGLPAKPTTAPADPSANFSHLTEIQLERRSNPHSSPMQIRVPEPPLTYPSNNDRGRRSPARSENPVPAPLRKRQPLPPQDKEFREAGRVKPVHIEVSNQCPRDPPRSQSPPLTFQGWEKPDREFDRPPQQYEVYRTHSGREDSHEVGYNQLPSGLHDVASGYNRGYEQDRPKVRQRGDDLMNQDRNCGIAVETPPLAHDSHLAYQERERDPPSKPRAMHQDPTYITPGFTSASLPQSIGRPQSISRYRDRPSPPHLSRSGSRQDGDTRPGPPPSALWQERRSDKSHARPDRSAAREPRGRQAPASSANSIPIGVRKTYSGVDAVANTLNAKNDWSLFSANDIPQTRNHDKESRSYQQESVTRPPREDPYVQVDERFHRADKVDSLPRNSAILANKTANTPWPQRQSRFMAPRSSLPEPLDRAQQKIWSTQRSTSPHRRFGDSARDATPPPMSQELSFTSSRWTPPSSHIHELSLRVVDHPDAPVYRKPPPKMSRIENNNLRQTLPAPIPRDGPAQQGRERYHGQQADFTGSPRPPQLTQTSARPNNRRDALPYFHETRRAPNTYTSPNGGRSKWDMTGTPADENMHNQGPRLLNERISEVPPEMLTRGGPRPLQVIHQDKGYNYGEPDLPEVHTLGHLETRQDNYTPQSAKTFEQRLDSGPMPRAASLLSRISHGSTDDPMMVQSLRDRVQTGSKRDRDDMSRSHLPDGPIEADDGDLDIGNRRRKRRRARRGGGP